MNDQPGVTHCVMRRGASWFAFPAERVREVVFRPPLLAVPHSDPLLAGLCHVRSEFLPVLRLDTLLVDDPAQLTAEQQMLVLHGDEGPWAILVDQVTALASLETSAAPEEDFQENWSEVVSGWAAHATQVVRVLDPQRFFSLAEHILCESWASGPAFAGAVEDGSDHETAALPPTPTQGEGKTDNTDRTINDETNSTTPKEHAPSKASDDRAAGTEPTRDPSQPNREEPTAPSHEKGGTVEGITGSIPTPDLRNE